MQVTRVLDVSHLCIILYKIYSCVVLYKMFTPLLIKYTIHTIKTGKGAGDFGNWSLKIVVN